MTDDKFESLRRRKSEDCLSNLEIDLFLADNSLLSQDKQAHLKKCRTCSARLTKMQEDSRLFAEKVDLVNLSVGTLENIQTTKPKRAFFMLPVVAGIMSVFVVLATLFIIENFNDDKTRLKSGPSFGFMVKRKIDGQVQIGERKAAYRKGDLLRFYTSSSQPLYFSIYDVESSGEVSVFLPFVKRHAVGIEAGTKNFIEGSIVLDDSLGKEYLVGVFCPDRYEVLPIKQTLLKWDRQEKIRDVVVEALPDDECSLDVFEIGKVE
jgi:hypothetical protein